jgi:hypothetical protein
VIPLRHLPTRENNVGKKRPLRRRGWSFGQLVSPGTNDDELVMLRSKVCKDVVRHLRQRL